MCQNRPNTYARRSIARSLPCKTCENVPEADIEIDHLRRLPTHQRRWKSFAFARRDVIHSRSWPRDSNQEGCAFSKTGSVTFFLRWLLPIWFRLLVQLPEYSFPNGETYKPDSWSYVLIVTLWIMVKTVAYKPNLSQHPQLRASWTSNA